jgi:hypothetical protein
MQARKKINSTGFKVIKGTIIIVAIPAPIVSV